MTPDGAITTVATPFPVGFFAFGPDGNLWIAGQHDIGEITPSGAVLHDFSICSSFPSPSGISTSLDFAFGADGDIWYIDPYVNANLGRLTPDGQVTEYALPAETADLISGRDGQLWFDGLGINMLGHIDPTAPTSSLAVFYPPTSILRGLTAGPDGNLWATEGSRNEIARFGTSGQLTAVFSVPTANSGLYQLTADLDGGLWFAEYNSNQIGRITVGGAITEYSIPTANSGPDDITTGPDGSIWFAELTANQLGRVSFIPTVGPITAPLAPAAVNTAIGVNASFTDAIMSTTDTAVWNWGDGTTTAGSVTETNGSGTVAGSHTYAADGVYTVTLAVTNALGGSAQSVFQYVVVYNPSAGFVTGGGWITSPAGAYLANSSLTGQANFGFNARYKSGATVPTGNTEFQFPGAGLNFHATSYDWLVITTNQAQFQGSGTINGAGNYGFLVTALDNGATTPGDIRLEIWDKDNGNAVVYDTQPGAPVTAAPTTALGGGRIQVHTNAQLATGGENLSGGNPAPLTPEELRPIVQEAIARWQDAGISPAQASALSHVSVGIAEFPGPWLGMAFPGSIWIDRNAAGYGWYIDPTPAGDSEFPAVTGGPAFGKVDLLTVVEHELGHELGYGDTTGDGLMGVFLGTGERRVPAPALPAGLANWPVQVAGAVVAPAGLNPNGAGAAVGSSGLSGSAAVDRLFAGYAGEDATLAALLLGDQSDGPAQGLTGHLRRRA
jgi:streptogramin lyase